VFVDDKKVQIIAERVVFCFGICGGSKEYIPSPVHMESPAGVAKVLLEGD
jgi:hypothetical protein